MGFEHLPQKLVRILALLAPFPYTVNTDSPME
jgi:hypothetical protein